MSSPVVNRRFIFAVKLLMALSFLPAPVFAASANRQLKRVAEVNRYYVVALDRTLSMEDLKQQGVLRLDNDVLFKNLLNHPDFGTVMAKRMAEFAGTANVGGLANQMNTPLDKVLSPLITSHKTQVCPDYAKASLCFVAWLLPKVSHQLGNNWVKSNESSLNAVTYRSLVDKLLRDLSASAVKE